MPARPRGAAMNDLSYTTRLVSLVLSIIGYGLTAMALG